MKSSIFLYSISLSILHANVARAYWRMACGVSQTSRTDPVLSPGTVSGHVHKFAGGNNVNPSSTQDSLLTSTCSTCQIQEDKSAYWTPQLYYAHSDGTFEEVQNDGMTVYYVGRGGDASNTVAFPPGFQMVSGNSLQRSYDSQTLTHENTRPVADREHYMFNTNCVNGMRAQINFQSCWDGQNLYLPNSEHVAYLSGIDYGTCPPTHPIPIPGLFYEVLYWTNRIDQSAGGQFVFSNGDATGYGFHGDFLNGWNQDVQTAAVQDCLYTDNGGVISACPVLQASDDVDVSRNCPESPSVWDEPVHGSLSSLPGCNPITNGPGLAPQVICPLNNISPTQSEAASLATPMATVSASSPTPPGFVPGFVSTTITTDAAPTPNFLNNTAVTTVTTTIGLPPAQQTPGIFAANSTAQPMSALTSSAPDTRFPTITPILSFTTMFVPASTSNPDASILASTTDFTSTLSTPTTSFITDLSGACSFFSQFSIEPCATVTAAATAASVSTSATDAAISTSTSPFNPQVTTTLVTQTQPITEELTSTFTTFIAPLSTATVQNFRIRRRQQQQQKQQQQKREETPDESDADPNANASVHVHVNTDTNLQADDLSRIISEVIAQTNAGSDDVGDETTDTSPQEKEQDSDDDASGDSVDDDANENDSADDTADVAGDDSSDTADDDGFSDGDDTYHGSGMGCMLWGRCG